MKYNLINIIVGLFFLIGALIALKNKENKKLTNFSVACGFIVLILLLVIDIIPETLSLFTNYKYLYIISGTLIGLGLLFILEKKVPHHDHFEEVKHHENHLNHIGIMTSVALIIHNIVEGMGIYGIAQNDFKTGIIYAIGVGLHNIPFGIEITAMLNKNNNKKVMWIYLILLSISTFIGGIILYLFKDLLTNTFLGFLLSITIGMIIYLVIFELFIELKENYNKYSTIGLITGIILMLIGGLLWLDLL